MTLNNNSNGPKLSDADAALIDDIRANVGADEADEMEARLLNQASK